MATIKKEIVLDVPNLMGGNNIAQAKEEPIAPAIPFKPMGGIGVVQPDITKETGINAGGLSVVQPTIAEKTGVDVDKITGDNVATDSSSITNGEQLQKEEDTQKSIDENAKTDAEILKLQKQKQLEDYRTSLGLDPKTGEVAGSVKPKTTTFASDYEALRDAQGIGAVETQINNLNNEITNLTSDYKATSSSFEGQGRGITSGIIRGQQGKLEEQYQNALQTLEMRKTNLTNELTTKNNVISTIMGLKEKDYDNAVADYNTQFKNQIDSMTAYNNYKTKEEATANVETDNARANMNIIINASKGKTWEDMDATSQVELQKLALKAGIPFEVVKSLVNTPNIEITNTVQGYDKDGNPIVSFFARGEDGIPYLIKTEGTGGVSKEDADTLTPEGMIQQISSQYTEKQIRDGLIRMFKKGIITTDPGLGWFPTKEQVNEALSNAKEELKTYINNADKAEINMTDALSTYFK